MGEKKQLNLFDRPETIKQQIKELSPETRQIIHRELYRFFTDETLGCISGQDKGYRIDFAQQRNQDLKKMLENRFSPSEIGQAIIYFLAELEGNKTMFVYEKRSHRTYTKKHLFEVERGRPIVWFGHMLKNAAERSDLSSLSPLLCELLLKNIGYGDGTLERLYLGMLGLIGTKDDIPSVKKYRSSVYKRKFGHPTHLLKANTAIPVTGKVITALKIERLAQVDKVLEVLKSRT